MENRKKNSLRKYSGLILLAMIGCELLCPPLEAAKSSKMRVVMGTLLQIEAEASDSLNAEQAVETGFLEVETYDRMLSNYKDTSEIFKINKEGFLNTVSMSQPMNDFILESVRLSKLTDGAFDITIEPLTQLWKLRERSMKKYPTAEEINANKEKVNYQNILLSDKERTLQFKKEGMGLDSGGIGKGYALDRALEKMQKFSLESATFNFGGEILYWSKKSQKKEALVRNPLLKEKDWGKLYFLATPQGIALSTSGNYERFVTIEGTRKTLGHLLNPKTGRPVENECRSVTAVASNATIADALSTALFVMGLEEGKKFLQNQRDASALFIYKTKNGELKSDLVSSSKYPLTFTE